MTDQDLTAPEAVGRYRPSEFRMAPDSTGLWVRYSDYAALSAALEAERGINRGAQAWVDYHAARAEAAEARERALLTTYDEDRKALVENTSLRSRLKAAEAKLKEAVDAATGLADWIEHEAGCELPFDARALRAPLDNPNK